MLHFFNETIRGFGGFPRFLHTVRHKKPKFLFYCISTSKEENLRVMLNCTGVRTSHAAKGQSCWTCVTAKKKQRSGVVPSPQNGLPNGKCCNHEEALVCNLRDGKWVCPNRECRRTVDTGAPLLSADRGTSALKVLRILHLYCAGMLQTAIRVQVGGSKNTVGKVVTRIETALALYADMRVAEINASGGVKSIQVDETAFSRRKFSWQASEARGL